MTTKRWIAAALLCLAGAGASAQEYPSKPVRIITGTAGNFNDIVSRHLAAQLTARWGQPVVVENRTGAGLTIGTAAAAQSAPDGYTLLVSDRTALAAAPTLNKTLAYDVARDLAPIALLAKTPMILVAHASVPAANLAEFIHFAKQQAQPLTFASAGPATVPHVAAEHFKHVVGAEVLPVQYKGSPASMMALLSGEVKAGFILTPIALPHVKAGKVRSYAITSEKRFAGLPDVATVGELGMPELESQYWLAMLAPARTPEAILRRLNREVVEILSSSGTQAMLLAQGAQAAGSTREELARFIRSETAKWKKVIEIAGMRSD